MKIFSFVLLLGLAVITGCKKQTAKEFTETFEATIELSDCFPIDSVGTYSRICFNELNDSRCPVSANCVWQGIAIAKFQLQVSNKQYNISLSTSKVRGFPSPDTSVAGFYLKLLDITSYPGTSSGSNSRALLRISR